MCIQYDNHSRFHTLHNWGENEGEVDIYSHSMSTKIVTLIMNKLFI